MSQQSPFESFDKSSESGGSASLNADDFGLEAAQANLLTQVNYMAKQLIELCKSKPMDLLVLIESHGTPVYIIPKHLLSRFVFKWLVGQWGFMPFTNDECRPWREKLLLRLLSKWGRRVQAAPSPDDTMPAEKIAPEPLTAETLKWGLFVLPESVINIGFLSHQLHHWLAFRAGLMGYSQRSVQLYERHLSGDSPNFERSLKKMTLEDMKALKAAINRETEALMFLKSITMEVLVPRRQAQQLGADGSASV